MIDRRHGVLALEKGDRFVDMHPPAQLTPGKAADTAAARRYSIATAGGEVLGFELQPQP